MAAVEFEGRAQLIVALDAAHVTPDDLPMVLGDNAKWARTLRGIKAWVKNGPRGILVMSGVALANCPDAVPTVPMSVGGADVLFRVFLHLGVCEYEHANYEGLVMIFAGADFARSFKEFPFRDLGSCRFLPGNAFDEVVVMGGAGAGANLVLAQDYLVIVGTDLEILRVMMTQGVPSIVKTASLLLRLFPYMRDWIRDNFMPVNFARSHDRLNIPGFVDVPRTADLQSQKFKAHSSIFAMGPAYSKQDNVFNQCAARGSAAAQSLNDDWVPPVVWAEVVTESDFQTYDRPGVVDEMYGQLLARNQAMTFNIETHAHDLYDIDTAVNTGLMTDWGGAIMGQTRMVFEKKHQQTLAFAFNIVDAVMPLVANLNNQWEMERALVATHRDDLQFHIYNGLRRTLPEARQVKSWPRLAYMGLLVHMKNLPAAQAAQFANYKIDEISNHINSPVDKTICQAIADAYPKDDVIAQATLIRDLPLATARESMVSCDDDKKMKIMMHISIMGWICEWEVYYRGQLARLEKARIHKTAQPIIDAELKEIVRILSDRIYRMPEGPAKQTKLAAVGNVINTVNAEMTGDTPIHDRVPDPAIPALQAEFADEIDRVQDILMAVRRLNFDNIQDPMLFGQAAHAPPPHAP